VFGSTFLCHRVSDRIHRSHLPPMRLTMCSEAYRDELVLRRLHGSRSSAKMPAIPRSKELENQHQEFTILFQIDTLALVHSARTDTLSSLYNSAYRVAITSERKRSALRNPRLTNFSRYAESLITCRIPSRMDSES
jgi:hypothetical protein